MGCRNTILFLLLVAGTTDFGRPSEIPIQKKQQNTITVTHTQIIIKSIYEYMDFKSKCK